MDPQDWELRGGIVPGCPPDACEAPARDRAARDAVGNLLLSPIRFDDTEWSSFMALPLTVAHPPIEEPGDLAATHLLDAMAGRKMPQ